MKKHFKILAIAVLGVFVLTSSSSTEKTDLAKEKEIITMSASYLKSKKGEATTQRGSFQLLKKSESFSECSATAFQVFLLNRDRCDYLVSSGVIDADQYEQCNDYAIATYQNQKSDCVCPAIDPE